MLVVEQKAYIYTGLGLPNTYLVWSVFLQQLRILGKTGARLHLCASVIPVVTPANHAV